MRDLDHGSAMLHINELTHRIAGRLLFEKATVGIEDGFKVGLVGRNGTGKSTLLRLIAGELAPDEGSVSYPKSARIGYLAQEAPGGPESLLDTVLAADRERAALLKESETATDPNRIAEIFTRLDDIAAHSAPARAARILAGLGFSEEAQARSCAELSGGWRTRVALAAVLFSAPDILLLDEPTNYLDLEGSLWLEDFIAAYPRTVLIVSHDRDFLNKMSHILHLNDRRLHFYSGGYDLFEETWREKQRLQLKLKKVQDERRRDMEAFVARFRAKASKARQAQSRLKALAKMQPIAAEVEREVVPFRFPSPERPLGNPLIRIERASLGYAPDRPVLANVNLHLDCDDRVGILGANGNGKSTLAKVLCGRLEPLSGVRRASKKLRYGYFAQHQIDDLNPKTSAFEAMSELMPDASIAERRAKVAATGFGADNADAPAESLSGGEKARLLFALASLNAPHLLVLDEPTNHLDVDSREALIHALNDYSGAVVVISHDRHLLEATVDRLWIVRDGTVMPYEGDLEAYRQESLAATGKGRYPTAASVGNKGGEPQKRSREDDRRRNAARRGELAPLRKTVTDREVEVGTLQKELAEIESGLADHSLYEREPEKARALALKRAALRKALKIAEDAWLEASLAYEEAADAPSAV